VAANLLEGRTIYLDARRMTKRWTDLWGSITLPSLRNNFAAMACEKPCKKPDRVTWHQQDHGVEELRWLRELRKCENVPD